MENINQEELNEILEKHEMWLKDEEDGECADLISVDLKDVDLSNTDLRKADLYNINLRGANLRGVDLVNADLRNADLRGADLRDANLMGADLNNANLNNANLWNAKLSYANLNNIETNMNTIGYSLACPEYGSFIGYKKANGCLVKLLILENAKRSSATTAKCKCDKAKVLDIEDIETGEKVKEASSNYDSDFTYRLGEIVKVDNFDNNRWNECAPGIHFFMDKENALNY